MEKKLTDIFPWNLSDNSSASNDIKNSNTIKSIDTIINKFILCVDRNPSNGDFSFDLLLSSLLSDDYIVLLLSLNHTIQHYELVLHKNVSLWYRFYRLYMYICIYIYEF